MTSAAYFAAVRELGEDSAHGMHLVLNGHMILRRDSLNTALDSLVRHWLAGLSATRVERWQRMPQALLYEHIAQDSAMQSRVEALLATPGISVPERAWIYATIIHAMLVSNEELPPTRLAIAQAYIARLAALPRAEALRAYFATLDVAAKYYAAVDRRQDALNAGMRAYALLAQADDETRIALAQGDLILTLGSILCTQPNGRVVIDSMMSVITHALDPSPAALARDTALRTLSQLAHVTFEYSVGKLISYMGRPAAPFIAKYWYNQPTPATPAPSIPEARVKRLDDGTIHVIGMGFLGCPGCHGAMEALQHLAPTFPRGVEVAYYVFTSGWWNGVEIEPAREVEILRRYYLEHRKYTFPIAIWAGNGDGDSNSGPMVNAYGIRGFPTFLVVDGKGIVRSVFMGFGRYETRLKPILDQLIREREHPELLVIPAADTTSAPPASDSTAAPTAH